MILGVHNMPIDTINRCDMDGQLGMKQNIILCGGKFYHLNYNEHAHLFRNNNDVGFQGTNDRRIIRKTN
jgi:hypothetical protein